MPALPHSQFLHVNNRDRPGHAGNSRLRMAIAPEDTIPYGDIKDVSRLYLFQTNATATRQALRKSEITHKRLQMERLDTMARREEYDVNAREIFSPFAQMYGSQDMLLRMDYSGARHQSGPLDQDESTTPYFFDFSFAKKEHVKDGELDYRLRQPVFIVDNAVFDDLAAQGVDDADTTRFFTGFMTMAGIAEHDYIHGMQVVYTDALPYELVEDDPLYYTSLERHALALHAQIMAESFAAQPKRKAHVLAYAHDAFAQVAAIQAKCDAGDGHPVAGGHLVNYLAAIYAHRFFRVVSPTDTALQQPVGADASSIDDVLDTIRINVPQDRVDAASGYRDTMGNKAKLLLNMSGISTQTDMLRPGIYADIHDTHAVDVIAKQDDRMMRVELLQVMQDCTMARRGMDKGLSLHY